MMTPDASVRRDAAERIGGPWALSWQVGVLAFLPAVLTAAFDAARHGGSPVAWIGCGLTASAMLFAALIPVRRWVLPGLPRYRRPRPALTIGVYLAAGAVRGTLVAVFAVQLGLQNSYEWGFRQIAGALIATTMLVTFTILVDAVASYRTGVRRLVVEEQRVAAVERAAERHREELVDDVRRRLLDGLRPWHGDAHASEPIDAAIDVIVHPLVDELRADVDLRVPPPDALPALRIGSRELAAQSLWVAPFHPLPVAIGIGTMLVTFLAFRFGLAGVAITAGFCVATALPLLVARAIAGRQDGRTANRVALITLAYLAMPALAIAVGVVATTNGPAAELATETVALAIAIITIAAWVVNTAAAAISAALKLAAIAERDLRAATEARAWTVARAEESMRKARATLASVVHGPVQSTLVRAAATTDQSDVEVGMWAKAEIEKVLAGVRSNAQRSVRLAAAFAALVDVWEGAATIRVHAEPVLLERLDGDPLGAGTVLEIVREGISNAVRHARARHVDVTVSIDGALATVIVASDASRSASHARRGLGTDMLDRVCTSWERTVDGDITRLIARVPVELDGTNDRPSTP